MTDRKQVQVCEGEEQVRVEVCKLWQSCVLHVHRKEVLLELGHDI